MITANDFYSVMSAMVPLYVAMLLAYGSVRWWKLLTPDQCSGINRFVAIFAVPLLSFQIISNNNPYAMSVKFILADALQKLIVFGILGIWAKFSRKGSVEWMITLFMLATLPNTLVMGIPLETAMYGSMHASIVVQAVVLQCIVWYTILIFLYEYRSAKLLILQKFPRTAASIVPVQVESSVIESLNRKEAVETAEAAIGEDGKIYVQVRRSPTSSMTQELHSSSSIRTPEISSTISSKASTPSASDLTNAELYSVHSSRNMTPANSFNRNDFYLMMAGSKNGSPFRIPEFESFQSSNHSSNLHTPREATIPEEMDFKDDHVIPSSETYRIGDINNPGGQPDLEEHFRHLVCHQRFSHRAIQITKKDREDAASANLDYAKELQMFVWSSRTSPTSPVSEGGHTNVKASNGEILPPAQDTTLETPPEPEPVPLHTHPQSPSGVKQSWFKSLGFFQKKTAPNLPDESTVPEVPSTAAMSKLILPMVWRKLIRNPNTYSSLIGLTWALISFKWNIQMPKLIDNSIRILSDAGLGMAMFSLGLFMALQPRLLACGTSMTLIGMVIRFVTGPAMMSATSIAVGLRNLELRASIVQAALPQGIVPFVFAKEYNVHPDVLSTAVIFGMLVSLPITLLYYVLLGL